MYTAAATQALLKNQGVDSLICSGEMFGYVNDVKRKQGAMIGFTSSRGESAHFWVETDDRIYDLAFSFLAIGGKFKAAPIPPLAWKHKNELPNCIIYKAHTRSLKVEATNNPDKLRIFVEDCLTIFNSSETRFKTLPLILYNRKVLDKQANSDDIWAQAVVWYDKNPQHMRPIQA